MSELVSAAWSSIKALAGAEPMFPDFGNGNEDKMVTTRCLLITANVGTLFEMAEELMPIWIDEIVEVRFVLSKARSLMCVGHCGRRSRVCSRAHPGNWRKELQRGPRLDPQVFWVRLLCHALLTVVVTKVQTNPQSA